MHNVYIHTPAILDRVRKTTVLYCHLTPKHKAQGFQLKEIDTVLLFSSADNPLNLETSSPTIVTVLDLNEITF